ncbi:MAG: hypothetical protein WBW11_16940, partial [Pseudolabrys sp.]
RRRAAEKRDELAPLHVPPENQAFPKCQKPSTLRPGCVRRNGAQPNAYSSGGLMSALGQEQTCAMQTVMSALHPITDIAVKLAMSALCQ